MPRQTVSKVISPRWETTNLKSVNSRQETSSCASLLRQLAYTCPFWLYWSRVNHSTCGYVVQICKASGRPSEKIFQWPSLWQGHFPHHTLSTEIRKNGSFLSTFSHLHTYRPIIIVIIFITLPGTFLHSSPFPRQISPVGRENWASNLLWQAELGKGQCRAEGDWSLWTVPGLMCVIWWGTRRGK